MFPDLFIYLFIIFFAIRTIRNTFYLIFLWQIKEYRLDRMVSFLKTDQGKRIILGKLSLSKWLLILLAIFIYFGEIFFLFVLLVYGIEAVLNIRELFASWKKPTFTPKAIIITIFALFFQFIGFILLFSPVGALVTDKLLPIFISLIVAILSMPSKLIKKIIINRATKKIKTKFKGKVIGITGSIGKTSVKEFTYSLLSQKFRAIKTEGSQNVDLGIARTILDKMTGQEDFFVVEIGAYKKGEIRKVCSMVQPDIGVITAIGKQHIDLFGSQEKIIEAKYELIESLPPTGIAIFNGDDKYCLKLSEQAKDSGLKTYIYGTNSAFDIFARDINVSPEGLEFTLSLGRQNKKLKLDLLGSQNIPSLLAAITVAQISELNLNEIVNGLKYISAPEKTMKLVKKIKGVAFIDDTFNASPESLNAALNYMNLYKGKKILVLTPLIELGELASKIHEDLGEKCANICDEIYLTNNNYYNPFLKGARKINHAESKIKIISSKVKFNYPTRLGSAILFEGKEAAKYIKHNIN